MHEHCFRMLREILLRDDDDNDEDSDDDGDVDKLKKDILYDALVELGGDNTDRLNIDYGQISGCNQGATWWCIPGEEVSTSFCITLYTFHADKPVVYRDLHRRIYRCADYDQGQARNRQL